MKNYNSSIIKKTPKSSGDEKTESISFRLNKKTLDKLRAYSATEGLTVNAYVNQLLTQAIEWNVLAAKAGWVPIPKNALSLILEKLDDKTIQQVADTNGKTIPKDLLLAMKGVYTIQEWISVLRSRAVAAGFKYSEIPENGSIKIITQHDMGIKWSNYFKSYYESSFKQLGCNPKFTVSENTFTMEIDKKFF